MDTKEFKDPASGRIISRVAENMSKHIDVETVLSGTNNVASQVSVYLDADNRNPRGSQRPRVRIAFRADGHTVDSITVIGKGDNVIGEWLNYID